jgi:hypothetical protein
MYNVGETVQFKYQNNMIGEFGVNTTVAIKYAVLKPKFLYNSFKNKGYLKDDFLPIQYSNLEEKDITYREINNFEEIYTVTKNESNMLMNKEYYKQNFPDIAKGEYKHFGAFEDEKLIGTSSMIKYFDTEKNKNKIYHLWSWTHSDFRRKGVWLNLMKTFMLRDKELILTTLMKSIHKYLVGLIVRNYLFMMLIPCLVF